MTQSINRYERGLLKLKNSLNQGIQEALAPPTHLSLSEWADTYAYLSAETSADAGKFKCFGYQRGMLDAITDPTVKQITVIKSARVGYTKLLDHVVGFFVHQDPSPILVVQPRVEDAEDYSRTEIAPMLRDTPVLADIVGDLKAKDSNQRILKRVFRNGSSVSFVGANSPGGFRRITSRVVLFDEIDGYPVNGAGDEGDQIALGIKRTESFWNRKIVLGSTPTIKGVSRVEKSFNESDQRHFHVACPHCHHQQVLKWENMQWNKDKDNGGGTVKHYPETAHFVCVSKGCIIQEHDKPEMIENGIWIADKPSLGHAGFHIWAAYSMFPNAAWKYLVKEFLRVRKDPSLLQTFVNLVLGETWEETGETVEANALSNRRENYDLETMPNGVQYLTAGVDVQDNRLEVQVMGWGAKEEAWVIVADILHGDPSQPDIWQNLDAVLQTTFRTEDGRSLKIRATCIDTGGHHGERVYAFWRSHKRQGVYAIKGAAGARPIWPKRASKGGTKGNDQVFIVGVDTAKDAIYSRLRIKEPGPGYIHFNGECDDAYFDQLTAEQVVTRYKEGRPYRVWTITKNKRNEALDLTVYCMCAMKSSAKVTRQLESLTNFDTTEVAPTAQDEPPAPLMNKITQVSTPPSVPPPEQIVPPRVRHRKGNPFTNGARLL